MRQKQAAVLRTSYRSIGVLMILLGLGRQAAAQTDSAKEINPDYYETYPELITGRTYFSQKYTSLILEARESVDDLKYRPNTTLNFGVGATYGWFTLNLAYGFDFLNGGDEAKGETRYLDLQSHVYTRKMCIDLFGQFYRGFYLHPKGTAAELDKYYVRKDVKVRHLGAAAYYIFDWHKLSMRAAMLQNEWQKKSAGSLLVGGEFYFGVTTGDSALVPGLLAQDYRQAGVDKFRYFDIGPGIGYAYTFVYREHLFAMGGITASFPLNFQKEWIGDHSERKFSISPDLMYRIGIGYGDERANISATWVNNTFQTRGHSGKYQIRTGNVRLNAAFRFMPGPRLKKLIRPFHSGM